MTAGRRFLLQEVGGASSFSFLTGRAQPLPGNNPQPPQHPPPGLPASRHFPRPVPQRRAAGAVLTEGSHLPRPGLSGPPGGARSPSPGGGGSGSSPASLPGPGFTYPSAAPAEAGCPRGGQARAAPCGGRARCGRRAGAEEAARGAQRTKAAADWPGRAGRGNCGPPGAREPPGPRPARTARRFRRGRSGRRQGARVPRDRAGPESERELLTGRDRRPREGHQGPPVSAVLRQRVVRPLVCSNLQEVGFPFSSFPPGARQVRSVTRLGRRAPAPARGRSSDASRFGRDAVGAVTVLLTGLGAWVGFLDLYRRKNK